MKITDAKLDSFVNRNFVFEEPIRFNTECYITDKKEKLDKIKDQINKLNSIHADKYQKNVGTIKANLINSIADLEENDVSELLLYPLKVKDYTYFVSFVPLLTFEKNGPDMYGEDIQSFGHAIGISYLQWIIEYSLAGALPDCMTNISVLMSLAFHLEIKSFLYGISNGLPYITINDKITFNGDDFDSFRKIFVFQNLNEKIIDFKNEAQRDAEKVDRIKNRNIVSPCFEQQIVAFCASKRCSKHDVFDMTIREFILESKMIREIEEYDFTKIGLMSGTVSFKNEGDHLEHYLFKDKKEEMEGFVPLEDMKRKINI